ncbi:DEAD/DEAH box helicase [Levilactobacillus huananensis]|uniref:DEAD/DEAH box helicase n=1 Tax=Levilactobacillus huananensis TaxID=2486019 RepID=UPI000F7BA9A3|nr:helicase-related protein [Levilactobacillus huananensis]
MTDYSELFGRRSPVTLPGAPDVMTSPAIAAVGQRWQCQRCGQLVAATDRLPNGDWYCRTCLQLGRLTSRDRLYTIPEPNCFARLMAGGLTWNGQLSSIQRQAARAVQKHALAGERQLLWAVTGAGKTEIVYPALAEALARGWRVAWVSPRVDVCLELAPRLRRDFAGVDQCVLYGGQPVPYRYCQLTICTTHQLLRFNRAFDWIIVDEVDAFPLATSPMLQVAIDRAQKTQGSCLYLTATPGERLQREIKRGKLAVTYLPLRYHGYLLPPIQLKISWRWRQQLQRGRLPAGLQRQFHLWWTARRPFLIFVPHVADLPVIMTVLMKMGLSDGATVHAADPKRQEKVQGFRDGEYRFLLTTTILERGVTFPRVAVAILGADDPVFSTAALVQIAGRVGRLASDPGGQVLAYCHSNARHVHRARAMIARLNRQGRRRGGRPC